MNNRIVASIVAGVVLTGAGVASADHMRAMPPDDRHMAVTPPGAEDRVVPRMPDVQRGAEEGRVVGRVLELDRDRGLIALATERGVLVLQGPPEALRSVEVGDMVSLVINGNAQEFPAASPREPDEKKP